MQAELVDGIAIGCWIGFVGVAYSIFGMLLRKYIKFEGKTNLQVAYLLVFALVGIGRMLLIYFDYGLTHLNIAEYSNYQVYWKIATLFFLGGLGFILLTSEYAVFRGKDYYVFFIGFVTVVGAGMLTLDFVTAQIIIGYGLLFAAFIPISYIYLAGKLPSIRKNIALGLIGFILFIGFDIFLSSFVIVLLPFGISYAYLISAIFQTVGLFLLGLGVNRMAFTK